MKPRLPGSIFLLLSLGLIGCHLVSEFDEGKIETTERKLYIFAQESDVAGVDLLFVVDTTDGTQLAELESGLVQLVAEVVKAQGGVYIDPIKPGGPGPGPGPESPFDAALGTVHVGFVSSDIGTPNTYPAPPPGCTEDGRGARLIRPVLPPGSPGDYLQPFLVLQAYWDDLAEDMIVEVLNYRGPGGEETEIALEDALGDYWAGVMATSSSCEFQQPLNAAQMALEYRVDNLGFYRDEAALGLVVIATHDDCSADYTEWDNELFSADPMVDLGPLTSFRCFEFGVRCAGSNPRSPGPILDCQDLPEDPNGGQGISLMKPAAVYATAIQQLKGSRPFIAAVLSGSTTSIEVELNAQSEPRLKPAPDCSSGPIITYPAVRLKAFVSALGHDMFYSLCNVDMTALGLQFMSLYENQAVERCFDTEFVDADLVDTDPSTSEIEPDCTIQMVASPGTAQETVVGEPPRCDLVDWMDTCWEVFPGHTCQSTLYIHYFGGEHLNYDVVKAECTVWKK
jgi:hypothetical protein